MKILDLAQGLLGRNFLRDDVADEQPHRHIQLDISLAIRQDRDLLFVSPFRCGADFVSAGRGVGGLFYQKIHSEVKEVFFL